MSSVVADSVQACMRALTVENSKEDSLERAAHPFPLRLHSCLQQLCSKDKGASMHRNLVPGLRIRTVHNNKGQEAQLSNSESYLDNASSALQATARHAATLGAAAHLPRQRALFC